MDWCQLSNVLKTVKTVDLCHLSKFKKTILSRKQKSHMETYLHIIACLEMAINNRTAVYTLTSIISELLDSCTKKDKEL